MNIIISEEKIAMTIRIIKDTLKSNVFCLQIKFDNLSKKEDQEIYFSDLKPEILSALANAYFKYVHDMVSIKKTKYFYIKKIPSFFKSLYDLKILFHLKEILTRFKDLKSITVYSFLQDKNKTFSIPIGRTTIELDADIITIIPPELFDNAGIGDLVSLHISNSTCGNFGFLYPLLLIYKVIRSIRIALYFVMPFIFFVILLYISIENFLHDGNWYGFISLTFPVAALPFLKKYISKWFRNYIRKKISNQLK